MAWPTLPLKLDFTTKAAQAPFADAEWTRPKWSPKTGQILESSWKPQQTLGGTAVRKGHGAYWNPKELTDGAVAIERKPSANVSPEKTILMLYVNTNPTTRQGYLGVVQQQGVGALLRSEIYRVDAESTYSLLKSETFYAAGSEERMTFGLLAKGGKIEFYAGKDITHMNLLISATDETYTKGVVGWEGNDGEKQWLKIWAGVSGVPKVTKPETQTSYVGVATELAVKGESVETWSATELPTGLGIASTTGIITGTPSAVQTKTVKVKGENASGLFEEQSFEWKTINPPAPTVTTPSNQVSTVGIPIRGLSIQAENTSEYILEGSLPNGLNLDKATGLITGTPTSVEITTLKIKVQNPQGTATTASFTWQILPQLVGVGPQLSTKYTLTGPSGTVAVFNEPNDPNYVGAVTEITGLDSPEVRENAENISGMDGGIHGPFYYGRRPITLSGEIFNVETIEERNEKIAKMVSASNAMRQDATLEWTPDGGEPVFIKVRRAQPLRVTGGWNKTFQLLLTAADPRIYSVKQEIAEVELKEASGISTGAGSKPFLLGRYDNFIYATLAGTNKLQVYEAQENGSLTLKESVATGTSPWRPVVSWDGKNVYVTNKGSNTITIFTRNTTNGALSAPTTIATGTEPAGIALSGDDKNVYCANFGSNTVSAYTRNTSTGALTALETTAAVASAKPIWVAWYPPSSNPEGEILVTYSGLDKLARFPRKASTGKLSASTLETVGTKPWCVEHGPPYSWGPEVRYPIIVTNSGGNNGTWIPGVAEASKTFATGNEPTVIYRFFTEWVISNTASKTLSLYKDGGKTDPTKGQNPPTLEGSIKTENAPYGIANPYAKGFLYVANEGSDTIGEYAGSGTFGVLGLRGANLRCTNKGSAETFPTLILEPSEGGSINNPKLTNAERNLIMKFLVNRQVIFDSLNRTITLSDGTSVYSGLEFANSTWWGLTPGENEVFVGLAEGALKSPVWLRILWRNAWI